MTEKYFAFYWTLPVPWVGFTSLPGDVDEAAKISRTIRYQRDRVRQHVRSLGTEMVPGGEMVRLELEPDRGSSEIAADFAALLSRAKAEGAMVAIVDFARHAGWRRHARLMEHYGHPCCDRIEVSAEDVHLAGFNPYGHFEKWRDQMKTNIEAKPGHRARVLGVLEGMEGGSFAIRAKVLNDLDLKTHGGKDWTAENLRKFLKAAGQD